MKFKPQDTVELRKLVEPAVVGAIQLLVKKDITYKVLSSNIMHTPLQPEGDSFTINVVVQINEKPPKKEE